jgi:acyl carrier protein
MTRKEIFDAVVASLVEVAPDVRPETLNPKADLRDQVELDSMDSLNLAVAIRRRLGVDIPETDRARLTTLDSLVGWIAVRIPT